MTVANPDAPAKALLLTVLLPVVLAFTELLYSFAFSLELLSCELASPVFRVSPLPRARCKPRSLSERGACSAAMSAKASVFSPPSTRPQLLHHTAIHNIVASRRVMVLPLTLSKSFLNRYRMVERPESLPTISAVSNCFPFMVRCSDSTVSYTSAESSYFARCSGRLS